MEASSSSSSSSAPSASRDGDGARAARELLREEDLEDVESMTNLFPPRIFSAELARKSFLLPSYFCILLDLFRFYISSFFFLQKIPPFPSSSSFAQYLCCRTDLCSSSSSFFPSIFRLVNSSRAEKKTQRDRRNERERERENLEGKRRKERNKKCDDGS